MGGFPFSAGRHLLMMKSSRQREQSRCAPLLHTPGTPAIEEDLLFRGMEEGRRPRRTAAQIRFWSIFLRGLTVTAGIAGAVFLLVMRFVYQTQELQDTFTMILLLIISFVPAGFFWCLTHEDMQTPTPS
uniref:Uncharacterized protein n=1 Tax=Hordeum vulgare subsp. vulgare TaxID=112509 RepID=A0A8I6YF44_HORVV